MEKSLGQNWRTVVFPGIVGKIVPTFALEGSPSFYVKCPRKCQKTYNFDIFLDFPKFTPLPLLNFEMNSKFDHIPLFICY